MVVDRNELSTVSKHGTPVGRGRLGTQTEETQPSRLGDRPTDVERQQDQNRGEAIGQDMMGHNAKMRRSSRTSRLYEGLVAQCENVPPDIPGVEGDVCDCDRNHRVGQTGTESRHKSYGEQDIREGEHDIDQAHDDGVDVVTEIACDQTDQGTNGGSDNCRHRANDEGYPGTPDDAR